MLLVRMQTNEKNPAMSRLPHVAGTHLGIECLSARLGGAWGIRKPPARAGSMDGPGGRSLLLLACREVALGGLCRGLGAPSHSGNACAARAFPVPRKETSRRPLAARGLGYQVPALYL